VRPTNVRGTQEGYGRSVDSRTRRDCSRPIRSHAEDLPVAVTNFRPLLAGRRVHQDEPEVRIVGVQCDAARGAVGVVVGVCEDARQRPVARPDPTLSTVTVPGVILSLLG
jgi:hypothetical protein